MLRVVAGTKETFVVILNILLIKKLLLLLDIFCQKYLEGGKKLNQVLYSTSLTVWYLQLDIIIIKKIIYFPHSI